MKRRRIFTETVFLLMLIFISAVSVTAMGNRDSGKPEPVEIKTAEAEPESDTPGYPPEGWITDIKEAYKIAQADDKKILINFTGSDWCVWCKKLSAEVFSTPEFKSFADENLVLLFLDFPNSIPLSQEQVTHNQLIAQLLNVRGYPSIWLLDSDYSPLMVTGYREGGAAEYIRHLSEDRPSVTEDEREKFRISFTEAVVENLGPLN